MPLLDPSKPYYIPDDRIFTQSPSRLKNYMLCQRYYLMRNVFKWTREEGRSVHLTVGTAWHAAKEYLRLHDHSDKSLNAAFDLYMQVYRKDILPEEDVQAGAKAPEIVREALATYCNIYDHDEYKVLPEGTEVEFTIDIGEGRSLTGRLDCIAEDRQGKLWVLDDKTSTRESYNWQFQWDLNIQMCAYIFAAQCIFGANAVGGVVIEGVFFKKSGSTHNRAVVTKTPASMATWYYNTMRWFDLIVDDFHMMVELDEGQQIMQSFPMRTESCAYHYGSICPYYDICTTWNNPLKRCAEVPMGFVSSKQDSEEDKGKEPKKVYANLKPVGLEGL